ncbi:oxalate/formate antiporter family transporter (macronuclear) [Tetrahymena thermophila SB210]|uniref:Oxalate/formate antiporter family transporter n=1 Tax=Tetrahymena thermophila (strain SB210) TaxID=312017 RepID=I7M7T8_TETTS|nr:oxalate/formate antiporter family transporter [Tetrahymena thermophila SB210]EAR95978.2 oxalate/formate antiporter family transporter [Tetrahymena thermophila SB210]|eukprot:XP_001016223.2 oxalate/formate antiporter family transporter [Tetrahymena thermophila SB210]
MQIINKLNSIQSPLARLPFQTRGYLSLFGGFLIHLILGTFYLWSTMNTYVTSYLRNDGQNYTNADVNAVFPFMMLAINICNPFGVILAKKIGFRLQAVVCSFILGVSVVLSSFFVDNFILFSFFYGFMFGFATGLVYMIPFNTSYLYFPHRKGFASGVISAGFGFGATLFLWLVYSFMNPHDIRPINSLFPKQVSENLPDTLLTLGFLYFIISLIGALLIERPTQEEIDQVEQEIQQNDIQQEMQLLKNDYSKAEDKNITSQNLPNECQTFQDGMNTKIIYLTIAMATLFCCYGIMIIANFKPYASQHNYNDSFLTFVATIGSIVNGLARLFWGYLMEKITFKQIILYNLGIQIFISSTLDLIIDVPFLFFIYIILAYFSYGGWYAKLPALVAKIFGKKVGTTIYGITFTGFTIAGWIQFFLVRQVQQDIGWGNLFLIFTVIQILSLIYFKDIDFNFDWRAFYKNKQSNQISKV